MLVHEQLLTAAGKQACKPFGATSSAPALAAATALLCTVALWSLAYAPPGETLREVARGDLAPRRRRRRGTSRLYCRLPVAGGARVWVPLLHAWADSRQEWGLAG